MTTHPDTLRAAGQAQAEQAADPRVILMIDAAIQRAAFTGKPFSANTIRSAVAVTSRGLVGARVDAARKRGELVAVGHEKSTLPSTRGHWITTWVGRRPETGSATLALLAAVACLLLIATGAAVALAPLLDVAGAL